MCVCYLVIFIHHYSAFYASYTLKHFSPHVGFYTLFINMSICMVWVCRIWLVVVMYLLLVCIEVCTQCESNERVKEHQLV